MNITGIKNIMAPAVEATGGTKNQPAVSLISERQNTATTGNSSPPVADVAKLQNELIDAAETSSELVQTLNLDSDLQFQGDDITGGGIICE